MKKNAKEILNKVWFILWKDDSLKGWIISLIFLFLLLKLIFFPFLSLITGTSLPIAIVESCSMYHKGNLFSNYNLWWETHKFKYVSFNITKREFHNFKFNKGLNKGDIVLITGVNTSLLKVGDVILFQTSLAHPIIHRIVKIKNTPKGKIFSTMGDNNNGQLEIEKSIKESQIIGIAKFKLIPYVGWIKLIFFEPFRNPYERGFCKSN